ncbi:MAG: universal stress protein [Bacteroidia bacterium]|nr:universal stress protein [Bacteroidia bacterium]
MNRILVPVNLRSDFDNILKYATSVGKRSGAELTLFYYGGRRLVKGNGHFQFEKDQAPEDFLHRVKGQRNRQNLEEIITNLLQEEINFRIKIVRGRSVSEITRESTQEAYDLVIMGTHTSSSWGDYLRGTLANRVIGSITTPVFIVPALTRFNDIQHITYAVDLTDYDSNVIQQVKSIAKLFDAKLSITHVNVDTEPQHKEKYLQTLERTISDTLDYPKIYYKFFDHADPLGGIVKFVNQNNSNLVAMINRKKFSWKSIFGDQSISRKISKEVKVPVLTFRR